MDAAEPISDQIDIAAIAERILALIAGNRLVLPGIPEVAHRIRQAAADLDGSAARIAAIASGDPALAAHLIKVSNSVNMRREQEIRSVLAAVMRLGFRLTAMTATSFSILQMMGAAGGRQPRVRALYQHSVAVGEHCFALAEQHPPLVPEDALLLGLVHDIGTLPILQYARQQPALQAPRVLDEVIRRLHAPVGAALLRAWHFPAALVEAVEAHEDWQRDHDGAGPDYTDLLIAANFHVYRGTSHPLAAVPEEAVPALAKVAPAATREAMSRARQLCGIGPLG